MPCATDIESSGNEDNVVDNCLEITIDFDIEDRYCWPLIINNRTIEIIIQRGPVMVQNMKFPTDDSGRSFSMSQYMRVLPNGEKIQRNWLVYSKKSNSVFCFCCKLFELKQNKLTDNLGFSDWRHLASHLSRHEISMEHMQNCKKWFELKMQLCKNYTIGKEHNRYFEAEKRQW
jgi:hypothetical protein